MRTEPCRARATSPPLPSRRRLLGLSAAGVGAMALGALAGGRPGAARARPARGIAGQPAPELEVSDWRDADGGPTEFSIVAERGRWVFLKCFQYWCPGCHASGFPTLQAMQEAFGEHPKVALAAIQTTFEGFSTNDASRIAEVRERYALTMPIGHDAGDPDGDHRPSTMRLYRTGGTPWLILIDPGGTVVFDAFHVDRDKLVDYVGEQLA